MGFFDLMLAVEKTERPRRTGLTGHRREGRVEDEGRRGIIAARSITKTPVTESAPVPDRVNLIACLCSSHCHHRTAITLTASPLPSTTPSTASD